jgi:hypothetical protein
MSLLRGVTPNALVPALPFTGRGGDPPFLTHVTRLTHNASGVTVLAWIPS